MTHPGIFALVKWTWRQAKGCQLQILAVSVLGIIRVAAALLFIWLSKIAVDLATGRSDATQWSLGQLCAMLICLMAFELVLILSASTLSTRTEARMKNALRSRIYARLTHNRWGEMEEKMHSGDLLNRLNEDVRVISEAVCHRLPAVIVMLTQLVGAFALLYHMNATLALCIISIIPLFTILSKAYVKRSRAITAEIRRSESIIHTNMQEGLQHHVVVQTLECEKQMTNSLNKAQRLLFSLTMKRNVINIFSRAMVNLAFMGGYLTAFVWCVFHLQTGVITFGTMTAFLQLVARIQTPMSNLSQSVPALVQATSSADRLIDIESLEAEDKSSPCKLDGQVGVRISDLTFSYKDGSHNVLENFNYDFKPGTRTLIMGETGVGKSTLVRLILALMSPRHGSVKFYNEKQCVDASPNTRCNIAYVPQGNSLLDCSIRDNLLLGNPSATDKQLCEALRIAVAEFVFELPKGLDSHCGELGASLSEGQAQRIAIARALLRDCGILLLDEFNSSLDVDTADTLMKRLDKAKPGCTVICISHRPEAVTYSQTILRL